MSDNINTKWRVSIVDIPPNSVKDILFANHKPNAFYIANNNNADLYISLTHTPTKTQHDLRLKRYDSDVFGRPIPTTAMYILNDSNEQVSVSVYSAENMFDMSVLKNFNVAIEESTLEAIAYDGVIRGVASGVKIPVEGTFTAQFPENLKVEFPKNAEVTVKGEVLSNLVQIATFLSQLIGNESSGNYKNLYSILEAINNLQTNIGTSSFTRAKGGVQITAGEVPYNFGEIDFLTNDSDDDLTVTITLNEGTTEIILKSGDVLNDIKITGSKLGFSSSGAINARYLLLG